MERSSQSLSPIPYAYTHLIRLLRPCLTGQGAWIRLGKFLIVGGTGVVVNTLALFLLYQLIHLPLIAASALAIEISIIHNFIWNDRWTFARRTLSFSRLAKFNAVGLAGLVIATATLWALATRTPVPYIWANLVGIGVATAWNFAVNSLWTWGASGYGPVARRIALRGRRRHS